MASPSLRLLALTALLAVSTVKATQWTVTSYMVVKETTSVWTALEETYTDTETFGLKDGVTPTVTAALSTETETDTYQDLKVVQIYLDGSDVDSDDMKTTTTYEYNSDDPMTYYAQPIVYTAPSSCPTAFTISTYTNIRVPSEVVDQVTPKTVSTSVYTYANGDKYTQVTAYLESGVASVTANTASDYIYSYYVADCRNPTATGAAYYGPGYGDDDDDDGGSVWNTCMDDSYCSSVAIYAIVLAALLPTIFLLGFLESYLWFRRMMIGKFSLRFGTVLWIFLLLPVLCFTRQCPARDPQTQEALRQQWKKVGFGKAIGLWFRWGFRHRYPVELLGIHPLYHNPPPGQQGSMPQMPPGPPPPGGYVYYAPGPSPDGQQAFQPGPLPPDGFKGAPNMQQMGAPPPGMVMYYPQYPPQAYAPQQQPPTMAPSPVSAQTSPPPSDVPQPTASPQPLQLQELSSQPVPRSDGPPQATTGTTPNQQTGA